MRQLTTKDNSTEIRKKDILKVDGKYLFTKDKIFYLNMEIKDVDRDSFEILSENVSKDKNNIYWRDKKVSSYENSNFKILDDGVIIIEEKFYDTLYEAYKNDIKT